MISPKDFGAVQIPLPTTFTHVRDLEEFDGPLLSEYRSETGESFLFHWCDRDRHTTIDRWVAFRARPQDLNQYLVRMIDLRTVILNCRDEFIYLVDTVSGDVRDAYYLPVKSLPEDYTPGENVLYRQTGAELLEPREEGVQEVFVAEHWGHEQLADYNRKYLFAYLINALLGRKRRPGRLKTIDLNLTKGWVFSTLYHLLMDMIPSDEQPKMASVAIASPGFINFKVDQDVAETVLTSVSEYMANRDEIEELSSIIGRWANRPEEKARTPEEEVRRSVMRIGELLGLHANELLEKSGELRIAVKTLRAYVWRVSRLAEKDEDKNAFLLGLQRSDEKGDE